MFVVYVYEDEQWKLESIHETAVDAELNRIEHCLTDDRQRTVKKLTY